MGQWINTWRPRDDSDAEIGLILEDDISVSPYAYRWLRAVHYAYRHRSDFAGATLQSDHVRTLSSRPIGPMAAPKSDTVFMYKTLGTWGMAPKALHWRRFQVSYIFTATNITFWYQHLFRRKCRTCTNHEVQFFGWNNRVLRFMVTFVWMWLQPASKRLNKRPMQKAIGKSKIRSAVKS